MPRVGRRIAELVLSVMVLAAAGAPARAQNGVSNPGMEERSPGGLPAGWVRGVAQPGAPSGDAYAVEVVDSGPHLGRRALRIASVGMPGNDEVAGVMQSIDATPYRGKTVWLLAYARSARQAPGQTDCWLRLQRTGGAADPGDTKRQPVRADDWRPCEFVLPVPPDAERLTFGLQMSGQARAWLDDVSLRVVPPLPAPEPPRPLTDRGLTNEAAFARLLGYVRFFHPSDEAVATDWNGFAIRGARAVEGATDAPGLAAVLDSLFHPIAPSVVVSATTGADAVRSLAAPSAPAETVVAWRHYGVGLGMALYTSDRIRAPAPGGIPPDSFAAPARPFVADLGGGVTASVPLTLYADSAGTLPRGRASPAAAEWPVSEYRADDRATRLAAVALSWTALQHFYPYFDVVGTDWSAELPRALRAAALDPDPTAFRRTLRLLVAPLHDGHGFVRYSGQDRSWVPPVGLGVAEGKIVLLAVDSGVPQLRAGDVVLAVDGQPIERLVAEEERLTSAATPWSLRYRALGTVLSGARGSDVSLAVLRPNGARAQVVLRRSVQAPPEPARPGPIRELRRGIWYIDISQATEQDYRAAIPGLSSARGLVVDSRNNRRGNQQAPLFWILPHLSRTPLASQHWQPPIAMRPDREGVRFIGGGWDMPAEEPYFGARRAFLIDAGIISAGETLMGLVEGNHLGDFVGEPTAGTNGNLNWIDLPGNYRISWTGMRVVKQDGSRLHGVGIRPTVPVSRTIAGIAAGRDEQLERALDLVDRR